MDIGRLNAGGAVSVVVDMMVVDPCHERHLVKLCYSDGRVHVRGLVCGVWSQQMPLDVEVVKQFPMPVLEICQAAKVTYHTMYPWFVFPQLVDAVSGFGRVAHGTHAAGVQTAVAVDRASRMTLGHQVHSHGGVVTGEGGHPQVVFELWQKCDLAALLSEGDSCQPVSQLGDNKKGVPCVQILLIVLKAAYLMQFRMLVLAGATPAHSESFVPTQIDWFARLTGLRVEMGDLDLHTVWPSWRLWSWRVISDPCLGTFGVTTWLPPLGSLKDRCLSSACGICGMKWLCVWTRWSAKRLVFMMVPTPSICLQGMEGLQWLSMHGVCNGVHVLVVVGSSD